MLWAGMGLAVGGLRETHRHAAITHIIHRALTSAGVPATLQPPGLLRSDGKRLDGVSMVPWRSRKFLVWDATCIDTFAPSYRSLAVQAAGAVAEKVESLKEEKYSDLSQTSMWICPNCYGVFWCLWAAVIDFGGAMQYPSWEAWAVGNVLEHLCLLCFCMPKN